MLTLSKPPATSSDLAATLPADFKRIRDGLEKMLHDLRQERVESNAAKGLTMGEMLAADKKLRSTAEGHTYESFTLSRTTPNSRPASAPPSRRYWNGTSPRSLFHIPAATPAG